MEWIPIDFSVKGLLLLPPIVFPLQVILDPMQVVPSPYIFVLLFNWRLSVFSLFLGLLGKPITVPYFLDKILNRDKRFQVFHGSQHFFEFFLLRGRFEPKPFFHTCEIVIQMIFLLLFLLRRARGLVLQRELYELIKVLKEICDLIFFHVVEY